MSNGCVSLSSRSRRLDSQLAQGLSHEPITARGRPRKLGEESGAGDGNRKYRSRAINHLKSGCYGSSERCVRFLCENWCYTGQRQPTLSLSTNTASASVLLRNATMCYAAFMKIRTITQRELRNQSGAVLREVEAGRTIIVSRNGTPVGELRPIKRRRFVSRATIADAAGNAARIDAAQFRADLDAVVDPHPHD